MTSETLNADASVDALKKKERQNKIRNEINSKESQHQGMYKNIEEKLQEKNLLGSAIELTMSNPAEGTVNIASPTTELSGSNHVAHTSNNNEYGGEHLGPLNMPHHIQRNDFKPAVVEGTSPSGVTKMTLNVDSEEIALHFIKKLFKNELISHAQMRAGKMHRSYLKFGEIHTESDKMAIELTTPTGQAGPLIDFINKHNPNPYDYPVPNMMASAIKDGNTAYLTGIKSELHLGKALKMDEEEDHTNVIDLQINDSKTSLKKL